MFRAASTQSLLKASTSDYIDAVVDDDDLDGSSVNENNLPAFLQNTQNSSANASHASLAQIWKNDDFRVKDPALAINDWLCKEDAKIVKVTVTEPRVVPSKSFRRRSSTSSFSALFTKNHALYLINIEGLQAAKENEVRFVERSFKDFALLRLVLMRRFPASCPPPLPHTKKIGSNRHQVVKKRARLLSLFLQTVADHPFFRNDGVFELFVASSIPFEESLGRFNGSPSEGTERWRQALKHAPLPKDAFQLIENVRGELKEAEKKLLNLKTAAKLEVEKAVARAVSSQEMVKALDSWLAMERTATSPLAGAVQVEVIDGKKEFTTDISLPDALGPLSVKYANHATALLHEYGEFQMETSVLDLTRFELSTLATWLENLELASQTEKKVLRISDNLKAVEALQKNGNQKVVETLKRDLDIAKFEQARYHRGLLSVELLRLKQARILRALRLKFSITKMHIEGAEAILSVWQGGKFLLNKEDEDEKEGVVEQPKPAEPPAPAPAAVEQPKPDPFDESKLEKLVMTVASKAVEESRAKAAQEEAERKKAEEAARDIDLHQDCKSPEDVVDMFWILVYCVMAVHVFFVLVFLSRGYLRESIPIVVLAALTFVAGFLVDLVHRP